MADPKKPATPDPDVHKSIRERAGFYISKLAESFGIDEAQVRDIISGQKISLGARKKQLEKAGNEPLGKFGTPIDLP